MNSKTFFYEYGKLLYAIDELYGEYAKKQSLNETELWILYALNDEKEHSQKEISSSWSIPRTTINTMTKKMKNEGLLEMKQIAGERRELHILLTDKGKTYAKKALDDIYRIEKRVFDELASPMSQLSNMREMLSCLQKEMKK